MKQIFILSILCCLFIFKANAQEEINDKAIIHQEQRMVYLQWDQNKFDPKAGFLSLNPYYWLIWGFFYPNYHKTDLRPLSATGPQTQRLALVGTQNSIDNKYKLQSDTVRNTALSQIASQSGLLSDTDPLWLLYYNQQFKPLLNYSAASLLGALPTEVSAKLVTEGTYNWYTNELSMLQQRLNGARATDMDRGSRIMAYYRMLKDYERLAGVWNIRISAAQKDIQMASQQHRIKTAAVNPGPWSPQTDVQIANKVLQHAKY
ncbi:hypothetical protein ACRQ5D_31525 [Mucilaginibacter sp. P25]|jgi:hypothetical protein|uniref:DUF5045 domain-containing protein n=1 Tax=Mucilaginibacter gossypiicola TaxID=551995 RepID=A0A1H8AZX0_9SPHI|nr:MULTISPECIES: hypothetical protein [Mucilaginibacter]UOE52210.1 hypothetical protein MTO98_14085 [Mucilaginibacter sp. SMC90]SEM75444.1 hypothetical protein SAMN05192574_101707 [Mucilaginibacter gossypiicola]